MQYAHLYSDSHFSLALLPCLKAVLIWGPVLAMATYFLAFSLARNSSAKSERHFHRWPQRALLVLLFAFSDLVLRGLAVLFTVVPLDTTSGYSFGCTTWILTAAIMATSGLAAFVVDRGRRAGAAQPVVEADARP